MNAMTIGFLAIQLLSYVVPLLSIHVGPDYLDFEITFYT